MHLILNSCNWFLIGALDYSWILFLTQTLDSAPGSIFESWFLNHVFDSWFMHLILDSCIWFPIPALRSWLMHLILYFWFMHLILNTCYRFLIGALDYLCTWFLTKALDSQFKLLILNSCTWFWIHVADSITAALTVLHLCYSFYSKSIHLDLGCGGGACFVPMLSVKPIKYNLQYWLQTQPIV